MLKLLIFCLLIYPVLSLFGLGFKGFSSPRRAWRILTNVRLMEWYLFKPHLRGWKLLKAKSCLLARFFLGVTGVFLLTACSPLNIQSEDLSLKPDGEERESFSDFENILAKAGCRNFQPYVWDYIYKIVSLENGNPPPYQTVKNKIIQRIHELMKDHRADKKDVDRFARRFVEIYALITEFMEQNQEDDTTETLVRFEYGAGTQESHANFINQLETTFARLNENAKALNQDCKEDEEIAEARAEGKTNNRHSTGGADSATKWDINWFYVLKRNVHPLVYGARKVMATAYQDCSVLDLPLMPAKDYTKGIRRTHRHPSGHGWRRAITSLTAVNSTHYYLRHISPPENSRCLDVRKHPPIYDYGGKPSTTLHSINLFRNSGSGSRHSLGVDCSGFVSSAMAGAGLRLKPKMFIRPIHVKGINSWMFKNARKNKLTCLKEQDISFYNPIRPGDIIASNSHVLIVEFTGDDPFGLSKARSSSDCHSRRIRLSDFDFTVIQSSAHNNGVGINRMHIKTAVDGLTTITRGLKRTASRACYKMFGNNNTHTNINEIAVLRHTGDVPACRDREIYLENQECLQACEPQNTDI